MEGSQRLADGAACLEAAILYAARGWCAIPLCPPDHVGVGKAHGQSCKKQSWGKAPLVAGWTSFAKVPAERQLRDWWKYWPNANVGLAMGFGGLVGIDTDGEAGERALAEMVKDRVLRTVEFRTPGGGTRRLYLCSETDMLSPRFEAFASHVEIRILGRGAQTVAPPSRHQSGGEYLWTVT